MQPKHGRLIFSILFLQLLIFWPVWRWYFFRIINSPDELAGIAGIISALFLIWLKSRASGRWPGDGVILTRCLFWPIFFNMVYCLAYPFSPPLIRGIIAFWAIGITLTNLVLGTGWYLGILGLIVLGLPLIPTLQFYLGYPLRWFTGKLTVPLLKLSGFSVALSGTCLDWCGKLVMIDAPCSGVKMLWTGLFLIFVLIGIYEINIFQTGLSLILAVFIILFGNILRSAALFYLEAGVIKAPSWAHEWIGLVAFLLVVCLIYLEFQFIRGNRRCSGLFSI